MTQEDGRLHIAICDDKPQELRQTAEAIQAFSASSLLPIRIQTFSDPECMLRAARTERFTHYFLDVMMPSMDGVTVAQEIRTFDTDARIVFLTSFKEYAYQAFRVRAHNYLLKPVSAPALHALLAELQSLEEDALQCLCIQSGRSFFRIPFSALTHVEISQKQLYFHTADGQVRQASGTLSEIEKTLLSRAEFFKIHRSYVVNLRQIASLSPDGCRMFSGANLPVSRLLYQRVQQAFMAHLFDGKEG